MCTSVLLMVGGGGAGGIDIGAGGGGGAVLHGTNIHIQAGTYDIMVGNGATPGETKGKTTTGFGATILGGGSAANVTGFASTKVQTLTPLQSCNPDKASLA
jgi:hypothetical protein